MSNITRDHKVGTRLSDEELWYCEQLALRHGSTDAGILRQGMMRWAREDGLRYPGETVKAKSAPKKKAPKH